MTQLELFPDLALGLRPPRRLRLLGLELERVEHLADDLADVWRRIERTEAGLAADVAKAKAKGHVPPVAYGLVVTLDEQREEVDKMRQRTDARHRTLERQLAKGIERHLKRGRYSTVSTNE